MRCAESDIVVACARIRVDDDCARQIRSLVLTPGLNWSRVTELARLHCVSPLLYRNLKAICSTDVPAAHLEQLRLEYHLGARQNLALTAEMLRVLDCFAAEGVSGLPFKGPMLAYAVYGDLSLRWFADLDILVRPDDLELACNLLRTLGYELEYKLSRSQKAAYIRMEHAFHFVHQSTGMVVELHWRLSHRTLSFGIDGTPLWERVRDATLLGRRIPTLHPEDMFLYLCMHGAKHYWERLEWICCISESLNRYTDLNWERIAGSAKRLGARRVLTLALSLAADILGNVRATELLQQLPKDRVAEALASQVKAHLFPEEGWNPEHREVYRLVFYLQARERLLDRARGLVLSCARIPHPDSKDWKMKNIPAALPALYYLVRPLRIAREYGAGPLGAVLRPGSPL